MSDPVVHPAHYANGPVPGVECIEISQWFNFNLGNAIKYIWRNGRKGDAVEDLRKARTYLEFEIDRLTNPDPFAQLPIPDSEFEHAASYVEPDVGDDFYADQDVVAAAFQSVFGSAELATVHPDGAEPAFTARKLTKLSLDGAVLD